MGSLSGTALSQEQTSVSPSARILIVDDDADFREFVRIVLESHGYEVCEAANVPAGLELMRDARPSLVLLDAMISYELAGVSALRAVRGDPRLARIPLIMVSAVLSADADRFLPAEQRALVDRFLSKPVSPDELVAEVAGLLAAEPPRPSAAGPSRPAS